MRIIKRDGHLEQLSPDRVLYRLQKACNDRNLGVLSSIDPDSLGLKVIMRIYDGISSAELDEFAAQIAAEMATDNPEYGLLASRIIISNMHKNTVECFSDVMHSLHQNKDINGDVAPLVSDEVMDIIQANKNKLNLAIDYNRDYNRDYFGFKTLERSYLMKLPKKQKNAKGVETTVMKIVERPQHMYMRVAVGIHKNDIERVLETYDILSRGLFTHATPTLFNAGTPRPQLSSCYLIALKSDSIPGIFETLSDAAKISKWAGGIGLHIHNLRGSGGLIRGTNGKSDGLVPMLKVFNETAKYVNQGGRRKGSIAVYLEPWHVDILDFLDMKKNHGDEDRIARDLFYALWISDLFMQRVKENGDWYLMCPDQSPGLADLYGEEFEKKYNEYIEAGKYRKKIKAHDVWRKILESQIETGTPYMSYKDAANRKSNQQNLGVIKSSNLCNEIYEYSSPTETAVCNLVSMALPKYLVKDTVTESGFDKYKFDHQELHRMCKIATKNLDRVIDVNFYPIPETQLSNLRHRPIGIGVQGLADVYIKMRVPFDSAEAAQINKEIFETMYHACVEASMELAQELTTTLKGEDGKGNESLVERELPNLSEEARALSKKDGKSIMESGPYSSFKGSPISQGKFQFDLWEARPESEVEGSPAFGRWDWQKLREEVKLHGVRNSLLMALMPTASTAQILGNNECMEPYTSNFYKRTVLSGEFKMINKHLVQDLIKLDLWNTEMKNLIIHYSGSVQEIDIIPQEIRDLYKTVWEIDSKVLIDQSADRAIYIDQSQSLNIFMRDPNINRLGKMHMYGWNKGLKTGQYYLRSNAPRAAVKVTIDPQMAERLRNKGEGAESATVTELGDGDDDVCTMEEGCISCGS